MLREVGLQRRKRERLIHRRYHWGAPWPSDVAALGQRNSEASTKTNFECTVTERGRRAVVKRARMPRLESQFPSCCLPPLQVT